MIQDSADSVRWPLCRIIVSLTLKHSLGLVGTVPWPSTGPLFGTARTQSLQTRTSAISFRQLWTWTVICIYYSRSPWHKKAGPLISHPLPGLRLRIRSLDVPQNQQHWRRRTNRVRADPKNTIDQYRPRLGNKLRNNHWDPSRPHTLWDNLPTEWAKTWTSGLFYLSNNKAIQKKLWRNGTRTVLHQLGIHKSASLPQRIVFHCYHRLWSNQSSATEIPTDSLFHPDR